MRLINADALEQEYRRQFESVYKHTRDTVLPSDFYIERKAAYNKELVRMEMEAFCEFLKSRPTIDAEPVRHGRWIPIELHKIFGVLHGVECSLCGKEIVIKGYNYCPNCGAKMRGDTDETE